MIKTGDPETHETPCCQGVSWSSSVSTVRAPEGIRTPNLLIRSQMLYPLSYGRMFS